MSTAASRPGLAAWTTVSQAGSDGGFFLQTGVRSPVNGYAVPAPVAGTSSAMTDSRGPGSHVLYQDFVQSVPVARAALSFHLFFGNRADRLVSPATLDFATPQLNQQVRVDVMAGSADPFSVAPADILLNVIQTNQGDAPTQGYVHYSIDVTGLLNMNVNRILRLRFAEVDNVNLFMLGLDNVKLDVQAASAMPEQSAPQSAAPLSTELAATIVQRARQRTYTPARRTNRSG